MMNANSAWDSIRKRRDERGFDQADAIIGSERTNDGKNFAAGKFHVSLPGGDNG